MGVDIIARARKSKVETEQILIESSEPEKQTTEPVTEPVTEPTVEPEEKPKRKRVTRKKAEAAPSAPDGEAKAAEEKPKRKRVTRKKAEAAPSAPELAEGEHAPEPEHFKPDEDFVPKYDMHSEQRYVDSTSHKTEFEKVLDELSQMSMEALKWDLEKFTRKFGDGDEDAMEKKLEAFYGGFITNAAIELYDHGCHDAAFRCLEQAQQVLAAKHKLEEEMAEIKAKQEATAVDLSGLFGDMI